MRWDGVVLPFNTNKTVNQTTFLLMVLREGGGWEG